MALDSHASGGQAGCHLQGHRGAHPPLQQSCNMAQWLVAESGGRANWAAVLAPLSPQPSPCRLLRLRTRHPSAPRSPHPLAGHLRAALRRPLRALSATPRRLRASPAPLLRHSRFEDTASSGREPRWAPQPQCLCRAVPWGRCSQNGLFTNACSVPRVPATFWGLSGCRLSPSPPYTRRWHVVCLPAHSAWQQRARRAACPGEAGRLPLPSSATHNKGGGDPVAGKCHAL